MIIGSIIVLALQVLVPLLFIVALWRGDYNSKLSWLASVLGYGAYIIYLFLFGAGWGWVSYYIRVAVLVAFLCVVYVSFRRTFRAGVPRWRRPGSLGGWASLSVKALSPSSSRGQRWWRRRVSATVSSARRSSRSRWERAFGTWPTGGTASPSTTTIRIEPNASRWT